MASLVYHSFFERLGRGAGDLQALSVKCALTSSYTPNKDHAFWSDVTGEASGTGYTAGGTVVTATVTDDDANDRTDIVLGDASWSSSTITASGAVYYVDTGVAGTSWLIMFNDFGSGQSSTAGTFTVSSSTVRIPT